MQSNNVITKATALLNEVSVSLLFPVLGFNETIPINNLKTKLSKVIYVAYITLMLAFLNEIQFIFK